MMDLNNYDVAAPILDEHQIPATFYISTGYINSTKCSGLIK